MNKSSFSRQVIWCVFAVFALLAMTGQVSAADKWFRYVDASKGTSTDAVELSFGTVQLYNPKFWIYRSTNSDGYVDCSNGNKIATYEPKKNGTTWNWNDTNAVPGKKYNYAIMAVIPEKYCSVSNSEDEGRDSGTRRLPASDITGASQDRHDNINVTWKKYDDSNFGVKNWRVRRNLTGNQCQGDIVATVPANQFSYDDGYGSERAAFIHFSIEALDELDQPGACSKVLKGYRINDQPNNFSASTDSSEKITVTWKNNSDNRRVATWNLYRGDEGGNRGCTGNPDYSVGGNVEQVVDNVNVGRYKYWIAAKDENGRFGICHAAIVGERKGVPVITKNLPTDVKAFEGQTVNLAIEATGVELKYQWKLDGNNISGANSASYSFTATRENNDGRFTVAVYNGAGSVLSIPAKLKAIGKPVITKDPESGEIGKRHTISFSCDATDESDQKPDVEWLVNGQDISGDEGWGIHVKGSDYPSGTKFRCKVSNPAGSTLSAEATMTVYDAPTIVTQPKDVSVSIGEAAVFCATAKGRLMTLTWFRDGTKLSEQGGNGESQFCYRLENVQKSDNGATFKMSASNGSGTVETSAVKLTVTGFRIAGRLTFPGSDVGIADAKVTATDTDGKKVTVNSDDKGNYNLAELAPGSYTVRVELAGHVFTPQFQNPVKVDKENNGKNGNLGFDVSCSDGYQRGEKSCVKGTGVTPTLECVDKIDTETFEARFGYKNDNSFAVIVPVGDQNKLAPGEQNRGQPVRFEPGTTTQSFRATFADATDLTWMLGKISVKADSNSKRCTANSAPVCDAGKAYSVSCQGGVTVVEASGSKSYDPEKQSLNYSWLSNCPDSTIENATSVKANLLLKGPGKGVAANCTLQLTVDDGFDSSSCSATVKASACTPTCSGKVDQCGVCDGNNACLGCDGVPNSGLRIDACGVCGGTSACLDCKGVPFGTASVDRCGVCEGDGQSCLNCVERDQTHLVKEMNEQVFQLSLRTRLLANRALNRLGGPANLPGIDRKFLQRSRPRTKAIAVRAQALVAKLPRLARSCNNQVFCTRQSLGTTLDTFRVELAELKKLSNKVATVSKQYISDFLYRKHNTRRRLAARAALANSLVVPRNQDTCM